MNTKEMLDKIERTVTEVRSTNRMRSQEEERQRNQERVNTEIEKKRLATECERKIRATGIVEIFEGLRDRGIVTFRDEPVYKKVNNIFGHRKIKVSDFTPAEVIISTNEPRVILNFDRGDLKLHSIFAYISDQGLVIGGKEKFVTKEIEVAETVLKVLSDPFVTHYYDNS